MRPFQYLYVLLTNLIDKLLTVTATHFSEGWNLGLNLFI